LIERTNQRWLLNAYRFCQLNLRLVGIFSSCSRSGTSSAFRAAVAREIQHFIAELADYLELENHMPRAFTEAQAEAMVTIVFSAGAEALDVGVEQRKQLEERLVLQLRMISKGAYYWYRREQEKLAHQTDE
jgi:hypothetical protein